jgi:hypothetical protein
MTQTEDILFVLPRDRELQFPAMAALQSYVNSYAVKMRANTVTKEVPDYKLRYATTLSDDDWQFFLRLGIELNQQPEEIGFPASVIELSDAKLLSFFGTEKHAAQICGAISGVECLPYPKVKTGTMKLDDRGHLYPVWVGGKPAGADGGEMGDEQFLNIFREAPVTCEGSVLVGMQSWRTYAVAAAGLAVVEILPRDRPVNWLSKWKNPLYRLIEEDHLEMLPDALASIEAVLKYMEENQCPSSPAPADKPSPATPTEPTVSTVIPARNSYVTPRYDWEKSPAPSAKKPWVERSYPPRLSKCITSLSGGCVT